MSFNQNLNGNGAGSENPMDMVLDNLGMDDELANDLNGIGDEGNDNEDPDLGDGNESFESNEQFRREPEPEIRRQQQQRPQRNDQSRQQPQPQPQQNRPLPRNAEVRADQRGNLIGPDGQIVARAGFEARTYQNMARAQQETVAARAQVTDVSQRLARAIEIGQQFHEQMTIMQTQLRERGALPQRLGITQQEEMQALQLAADIKRDPAAGIRKILTMAAAAGIDVTKIGIAPGGVDAKSLVDLVRQEITQAMNPLKERTAVEQRQQQVTEQQAQQYRSTETEVNSFFNENPGAREHIPVFHAVLSNPQFANMSLGEVWARIQLNQTRNAMQQNSNGRLRQQNPQQRRTLPSGRGQPPFDSNAGEVASPNMTYDQILRETLDTLGV
jgi:hypothetical protein